MAETSLEHERCRDREVEFHETTVAMADLRHALGCNRWATTARTTTTARKRAVVKKATGGRERRVLIGGARRTMWVDRRPEAITTTGHCHRNGKRQRRRQRRRCSVRPPPSAVTERAQSLAGRRYVDYVLVYTKRQKKRNETTASPVERCSDDWMLERIVLILLHILGSIFVFFSCVVFVFFSLLGRSSVCLFVFFCW